ncbi:MAG: N-acetyltransferase family protein [Vicinamibacterales bacterium]
MAGVEPSLPTDVVLADGTSARIRPLAEDDGGRIAAFQAGLSARSVHQRYFHLTSLPDRIAQARQGLSTRDGSSTHGMAIVAERLAPEGRGEVMAVGHLTRVSPPDVAEVALIVQDRWQGVGLGGAMMRYLVAAAPALGLRRLYGDMLADNDAMRALVRRAGFVVRAVPGDGAMLHAELTITAAPTASGQRPAEG